MIDWQKTKFRASSWGNLLTEPVTKAAKEAGELSITCQKELIKIYNMVKYNRRKDITTAAMEKGKQVQTEGIKLYSLVEGELYAENFEQLENDFFTGKPDMYLGDRIYKAKKVDDLKNCWELDTFTPKLIEEADKGHTAQLNVYFDLTGAKEGAIVYALLNCPDNILEGEKRKLLYQMNVISEISPEYLEAAAELERNLTFPDIDYREKIIKAPVQRDEELIQKMKDKVPVLRNWLQDFNDKHMALYPKS